MGELLPEFWSVHRLDEGEWRDTKTRRSRQVTDIFTWLQCFGSYVAVLAVRRPHLIPEMMAYMGTIIRVSQDYSGLAWVRYDAAFRRQAALVGNDKWSVINTTIYTMCFTGMASSTKRCELCFASSHTERECAQRGDPDPDRGERLKNLEAAVVAISKPRQGSGPPTPMPVRPSGEVCRKWNRPGCNYRSCRHAHVCSICRGDHPAIRCQAKRPLNEPPRPGMHQQPRPY